MFDLGKKQREANADLMTGHIVKATTPGLESQNGKNQYII